MRGFGYYGTDVAKDVLTYRPGVYSGRPYTHFHLKVWRGDADADGGASRQTGGTISLTPALITQFYLRDEVNPFPEEPQLDVVEVGSDVAEAYGYGSYVNGTLVVDVGGWSGAADALLEASPRQAEGPYYPVAEFFDAGNDLTGGRVVAEALGDEDEKFEQQMEQQVRPQDEEEEPQKENDNNNPGQASVYESAESHLGASTDTINTLGAGGDATAEVDAPSEPLAPSPPFDDPAKLGSIAEDEDDIESAELPEDAKDYSDMMPGGMVAGDEDDEGVVPDAVASEGETPSSSESTHDSSTGVAVRTRHLTLSSLWIIVISLHTLGRKFLLQ